MMLHFIVLIYKLCLYYVCVCFIFLFYWLHTICWWCDCDCFYIAFTILLLMHDACAQITCAVPTLGRCGSMRSKKSIFGCKYYTLHTLSLPITYAQPILYNVYMWLCYHSLHITIIYVQLIFNVSCTRSYEKIINFNCTFCIILVFMCIT